MLLGNSQFIENVDEGNLSRELEIARFKNYGREKFSSLVKNEIYLNEFLRETSQHYSLQLPSDISDFFIRMDYAEYFWLSENPLIEKLDILLGKNSGECKFVSNHREIKKQYLKWAEQKNPKEKQFVAINLINILERNFAYQSFFNLAIYATILIFDKNLYNAQKAINLLDISIEQINSIELKEELKPEILYYINIFKGFAYLKEYEYLNARQSFIEANKHNDHGITAYFYLALTSRYLDDFDSAFAYLKEILQFDRIRFKFAINFNHFGLLSYFYKNAVFYNVFTEIGFAQMLPDIDFLLKSLYSNEVDSLGITYAKLINLDNLRIKEFFDDKVIEEIEFLKKVLDNFKNKKNGLIRIVEQILRDKLKTLIEYIRSLIENYYFEIIKEDIISFDKQIEQNKRQLNLLIQERDDAQRKLKLDESEASQYLEETVKEQIKILEEKIEHLDHDNKYDPSQVFYSSMIFTSLISFIVFISVGLISLFVGAAHDSEYETTTLGLFFRTGIMWGAITFFMGTIISIFTAISSNWEKNSEKKLLLKKLNFLKESESEEKENLLDESKRKALIFNQKFNDRIKAQEKILESFVKEREIHYLSKQQEAQKEIQEYIEPLEKLLQSL